MKKQSVIRKMAEAIIVENGRRTAFVISPENAKWLYERFMAERALLRKYRQDAATLTMTYDPHYVPNCYKFRATGTAAYADDGAFYVRSGTVASRPRGRKWSIKFEFEPNETCAVPPGYSTTGVKRI